MYFIFVLNFVKFYGKEGNHFSLDVKQRAYLFIIYMCVYLQILSWASNVETAERICLQWRVNKSPGPVLCTGRPSTPPNFAFFAIDRVVAMAVVYNDNIIVIEWKWWRGDRIKKKNVKNLLHPHRQTQDGNDTVEIDWETGWEKEKNKISPSSPYHQSNSIPLPRSFGGNWLDVKTSWSAIM